VTSIPQVMTQPHKEALLTENRRTCSYGWKPSSAQEREFRLFANTHNIMENFQTSVVQDVDGKASSTCKHRISITAGITLKDRVAAPLN
jgi:hypothetical protein